MRGMATLLRGRSVHDPENAIEDDDRTSRYKIRDGIVAQKSDEEPWQNISGQQHRNEVRGTQDAMKKYCRTAR